MHAALCWIITHSPFVSYGNKPDGEKKKKKKTHLADSIATRELKKKKRLHGTWCGFLQSVPAVKGPLLLLTQVGAMLQQPMGDPALADAWKAARR